MKIERLLYMNMNGRFVDRALRRYFAHLKWLTATNANRQQNPPQSITRYDGGPAQRRRRHAASLVYSYFCLFKTQFAMQ